MLLSSISIVLLITLIFFVFFFPIFKISKFYFQFYHFIDIKLDKILEIPNTDSLVKSTLTLLTNSQYYCDITFHFPKDNKCLYAHKGILVTRCELFATMFRYKQ